MKHTRADYARCAAQGMTIGETAENLGVTYDAAMKAQLLGIKFHRAQLGRPPARSIEGAVPRVAIARILRQPMTTGQISQQIGITTKSTLYHLGVMAKMGLVRHMGKNGVARIWGPKSSAT